MYCEEFSVTRGSLWMVSADTETHRNSVLVYKVWCIIVGMYIMVIGLFQFLSCSWSTPQFIEPEDSLPCSQCVLSQLQSHILRLIRYKAAHKVYEQRQMQCIYHVKTVDPTSLPPELRSAEFAVVNNSECDAAYRLNQGPRDLLRP